MNHAQRKEMNTAIADYPMRCRKVRNVLFEAGYDDRQYGLARTVLEGPFGKDFVQLFSPLDIAAMVYKLYKSRRLTP